MPRAKTGFLSLCEQIAGRYTFLVIHDPSRTGKTSYCRQVLGDVSKVLALNCASGAEPDLRAFMGPSSWRHAL